MSITRSKGINPNRPGIAWAGPWPGGGHTGLTPELDAFVSAAARAMDLAFPPDVEIRFNADRRSGGAWLVTPNGGNANIGICARLPVIGILTTVVACVRVRAKTLIDFGTAPEGTLPLDVVDFPIAFMEGAEDAAATGAVRWIREFVRPEHLK